MKINCETTIFNYSGWSQDMWYSYYNYRSQGTTPYFFHFTTFTLFYLIWSFIVYYFLNSHSLTSPPTLSLSLSPLTYHFFANKLNLSLSSLPILIRAPVVRNSIDQFLSHSPSRLIYLLLQLLFCSIVYCLSDISLSWSIANR